MDNQEAIRVHLLAIAGLIPDSVPVNQVERRAYAAVAKWVESAYSGKAPLPDSQGDLYMVRSTTESINRRLECALLLDQLLDMFSGRYKDWTLDDTRSVLSIVADVHNPGTASGDEFTDLYGFRALTDDDEDEDED